MRLKIFQKGLILVGTPLLISVLLIVSLGYLLICSDREHIAESNYRRNTAITAKLMALTYVCPYYLVASIQFQKKELLNAYKQQVQEIKNLQEELHRLSYNDPQALVGANELIKNQNRLIDVFESFAEVGNGPNAAMHIASAMPKIESEFNRTKHSNLSRLNEAEERGKRMTLISQQRLTEVRGLQTGILLCGIAANILAGIMLILFYQRNITNRVKIIAENAQRLAQGQDLIPKISGNDEIQILDQAFHSMSRELKEASERERNLFNNASDVICVLDPQNRFTKINPASYRLWGYEPEELIGKTFTDLLTPDSKDSTLSSVETAKKNKTPVEFENTLQTKNGKNLDVLWSAYWSETEQSLFCVVHDINDQKNIERTKKQFLSIITLDLKAPLGSISDLANKLIATSSTTLPQRAKDRLEIASKNIQRLVGLVNDLLQVTALDSGKLTIQRQRCDSEELLKRAAQDVESLATKQNITLHLGAEAKGCYCYGDPNRIIQVLVNLLSNAIKFSPPGGTVYISAASEQDHIKFAITDKGRGIPESQKELVFEKFKQVEATDGKRKTGTGLGLPICKQIVKEHGGTINVDSSEGKGSTFWFNIPTNYVAQEPIKAGSATQSLKIAVPSKTAGDSAKKRMEFGGSKLNLIQKGAILIGIPLIFELVFVGSLAVVLVQTNEERAQELHERMIAFRCTQLLGHMLGIGMLMNDGFKQEDWLQFKNECELQMRLRQDIKQRLASDPVASVNFEKIENLFHKFDEFNQSASSIIESNTFSAYNMRKAWGRRHLLLPASVSIVHKLQRLVDYAQHKEFISPVKQQALRQKQGQILLAGLLINILISLFLALFFSRNIISRLKILTDNTERLAKGEALNPELQGDDEIAQLDRLFHSAAKSVNEARQKESAVFDNSQDLICELDKKGNFVNVNQASKRLLQYSQNELIKKSILDVVSLEDRENMERVFASDYSKLPPKSLENRLVRKDGSPIYTLWSFSEAQGSIFGTAHNITQRKELESLKQEFLSMVSHDLRTPLTSIIGTTKLMIAGAFGELDNSTIETLSEIDEDIEKLLELINDLLDIEKLEAGEMQLILESIPVKVLMEESIKMASKNSIDTLFRLENTPDNMDVSADKERITQAISNILSYLLSSKQGAQPINIQLNEDGNWLEVKMHDSSPLEGETAQVFNRYQNTSASQTQSAGLSLSVAQKIIERHGGKAGVEKTNTTGKIFWIRLPINRNRMDSISAPPA